MNSRIILSTADFSANNIGRYGELSDLTKAVLAKQTQYDESSAQAADLNTFLNNLVENGFLGGENPLLKVLVLPCLGASINEALINIAGTNLPNLKDNTTEGSMEMYFVNDVNKGVKGKLTNKSWIETNYLPAAENQAIPGMSYGIYCTLFGAGVSFLNTNATNYNFTLSRTASKLQQNSTDKIKSTYSDALAAGFMGFVYNDTTPEIIPYNNNGLVTHTVDNEAGVNPANLKVQSGLSKVAFSNGGAYTANLNAISCLFVGDKLTGEQMLQLKGYINTLMTNLNIA